MLYDRESVMGVSNNFSSPIMGNTLSSNSGLFNDKEPTRVDALRIKAKYQPLTNKEKDYLQRYYYMEDRQQDKDERYVLGEGYKLSKKLLG